MAIALEKGLSPAMAHLLKNPPVNTTGTLLLALHHMHEGKRDDALPIIFERLDEIPHCLLIPNLQHYASESEFGKRQWFFKESERPQILEMIERPLTSVYGSRITSWTFTELRTDFVPDELIKIDESKEKDLLRKMMELLHFQTAEPKMFAVTGHGSRAVCARVSAILNDLANDRNCPSDLILAGASFFDLTEKITCSLYHNKGWDQEKLVASMRKLAMPLSIDLEDMLEQKDIEDFVEYFAGKMLKPTISHATESLAHIEKEMGFLVNKKIDIHELDAARSALAGNSRVTTKESFPVLNEYQNNGKPLRISLPLICLGIKEYEKVINEYRRSSCTEMRQEWKTAPEI